MQAVVGMPCGRHDLEEQEPLFSVWDRMIVMTMWDAHSAKASVLGGRHAAAPSAGRLALGVLRSACPLSLAPRGDDGADI